MAVKAKPSALKVLNSTPSDCARYKDKWKLSWQITPRGLTDPMARGGEVAKRAFKAMMTMKKIVLLK